MFYVGLTLIVPTFPPAQMLREWVGIPLIAFFIGGISVTTLLNGIINGTFWTTIVITAYGLTQLVLHTRKRKLPPMPVARHLKLPPPENPLVDPRVNRMPPALTVEPARLVALNKEPARVNTRSELAVIDVSKDTTAAELDVETIEGIGSVRGALLRNIGINTVIDLLKVGATHRGRRRLANATGVTSATVLKWVYRGDLLRVRGIGTKYSALLESAGVNTVTDLSTKNPDYLRQTLKIVNSERDLVRRTPPSSKIEIWIRNAKNLEPIPVE